MDNKNNSKITDAELRAAFTGETIAEASKKARPELPKSKPKTGKKWLIFTIIGGISLAAGTTCLLLAFLVFGEGREINFSFYIGVVLILLSVLLQTRRALHF